MEKLLGVQDIMERYHLKSRQTAAKRMWQMDTQIKIGKRILVPQSAVERYDKRFETHPPAVIKAAIKRQRMLAAR